MRSWISTGRKAVGQPLPHLLRATAMAPRWQQGYVDLAWRCRLPVFNRLRTLFPTQTEWDGDDGGYYILCFVFLKTQYVVLTSRSSFYTLCLVFAFLTTYGVLFSFLFYM